MPIDMPLTPGFTTSRFGLETNTQRFESPLSKAVQRVLLGGARWVATYTLPPMNRAQAAPWIAFLLKLEGGVNTFNAYDPDCKTTRGVATGTPLVKGASQTGSSLITDGWTVNVTGILKAGDYFTVNGELKIVTADANSNGSGEATISFMPRLRNSPADNVPLTISTASCPMILADDQQALWETNHNGIYQPKSFTAIEVFS